MPHSLPGLPFLIVDAHHHLWNLQAVHYPWLMAKGEPRFFGDPTSIQHDYDAGAFRDDWQGVAVGASVHIQVGAAQGEEVAETAWLDAQAEQTGLPTAIVAFADMTSPDFALILNAHRTASKRVVGIRQIVGRQAEEDRRMAGPALLLDPLFLEGLRRLEGEDLAFDLQLTPPLLEGASNLFAKVPGLRVVLCHAGSWWDRSAAGLAEWRSGMRAFATLSQSTVKLSGFAMFDPCWTEASIAAQVREVLDIFGPERVMWGSNFPVDRIYRGYAETLTAVAQGVPERARKAVFAGTARRVYRITGKINP